MCDCDRKVSIKVFSIMTKIKETRHASCACKCRLDASVCNNIQRWNDDKFRCKCKELIGKGKCDHAFIWDLVYVNMNVINCVTLDNT